MRGLPQCVPPDDRTLSWAELERWIAERASKRDPDYRPAGNWRTFLRKEGEFSVYTVNAEWVYNNLTVQFGHGGHGYVHECIPLDEIWVAKCHTGDCAYQEEEREAHRIGKEIDAHERDCIIVHEIAECLTMQRGDSFWVAHNKAMEVEQCFDENYSR
jgi:hypothetical protein